MSGGLIASLFSQNFREVGLLRTRFGRDSEFEALLRQESATVDLVKIAREISRDIYPRLVIGDYLAKLEALAERVRQRCPKRDDVRHVLGQIHWVLFVEEGYRGNHAEYYDPRNSYLNEVIDRRTGIPLTLALIYWRIAEATGLAIRGVNAPSHFLLRVEPSSPDSEPLFIDPFHDGRILDFATCRAFIAEAAGKNAKINKTHFEPCSPRIVVARLLRNLKAIHLAASDYTALLPVQRRLCAVLANDPIEQRDLGMLYYQMQRSIEAIPHLEAFLLKGADHPEFETSSRHRPL